MESTETNSQKRSGLLGSFETVSRMLGSSKYPIRTFEQGHGRFGHYDHEQDGQRFLAEPGMLGVGDMISLMQDFDGYVRP